MCLGLFSPNTLHLIDNLKENKNVFDFLKPNAVVNRPISDGTELIIRILKFQQLIHLL